MIIGVIGDLHIPYELDGYRQWCAKIFRREKVQKYISVGDIIDHHALSFHESEPMLKGVSGELLDARDRLKPWFKTFPKLTICAGNHDLIPKRQLKKVGMDAEVWMRPLAEVYDFPPGWKLVMNCQHDGVLYHHGYTSVGANGFRLDAERRMTNTVSGHAHSNGGISASACEHRLVWGLAVGCGVDMDSMAYAYAKDFPRKSVISCAVIKHGEPHIYYMPLGEKP